MGRSWDAKKAPTPKGEGRFSMSCKMKKTRRADEFGDQQHDGQETSGNDAMHCNADRLTPQSTPSDELRNQWASVVAEESFTFP